MSFAQVRYFVAVAGPAASPARQSLTASQTPLSRQTQLE